jgi:hypothetical protein
MQKWKVRDNAAPDAQSRWHHFCSARGFRPMFGLAPESFKERFPSFDQWLLDERLAVQVQDVESKQAHLHQTNVHT